MSERKNQVLSLTADKTTVKLVTAIAATETNLNRSEAFRLCVHEAAVKRGLVQESTAKHEK